MPDNMNLDSSYYIYVLYFLYLLLKLLYFQKYEVMAMSVAGGQPKKHANHAVIKLKKTQRKHVVNL